jgi:histidine phosphotransferase ChpT
MTQSLRLAELLASRLCHDLSGPINTLDGVLELARDDPLMQAEALGEASEAAAVLTRRLRLLRAAWGGLGEAMSVQDLARFGDGLPGSRLRVDLAWLEPGVFDPAAGRLVLNVLLLCAACLPLGGTVALVGSVAQHVVATIDGPRAAWPPGFAAILTEPDLAWQALAEMSPRDVQAVLTVLIARDSGLRISMLLSADKQDAPPLLIGLLPG